MELKCVERLTNEHLAQCINYLKASGLTVALLINFQKPRLEWRRVLLSKQAASGPAGSVGPEAEPGPSESALS